MSKQIRPIPQNIGEYLKYDPSTDTLIWIKRPGKRVHVGDVAGSFNKTYKHNEVRFRGELYLAHRVIWFLKTGEQPPDTIDNKDHNRSCNSENNLRAATRSQNQHNRGKPKNNTSGYKGVCWSKARNKWQASIKLNYKAVHLGYFDTPELAHTAYCNAADRYHKEFKNYG